MKTVAGEKLTDLTEHEQRLMDQSWDDFKGDVSMKQLIADMDKAIKRRRRLYYSDNPAEQDKIEAFRKQYKRWKPIKILALTLYMLLPFFEKPGWCL